MMSKSLGAESRIAEGVCQDAMSMTPVVLQLQKSMLNGHISCNSLFDDRPLHHEHDQTMTIQLRAPQLEFLLEIQQHTSLWQTVFLSICYGTCGLLFVAEMNLADVGRP